MLLLLQLYLYVTDLDVLCSVGQITVMKLDQADLSSVMNFVEKYKQLDIPLHILINNAGIFSMSAPRSISANSYEMHLLTNYLSVALLTIQLLPALKRGAADKNVQLVS